MPLLLERQKWKLKYPIRFANSVGVSLSKSNLENGTLSKISSWKFVKKTPAFSFKVIICSKFHKDHSALRWDQMKFQIPKIKPSQGDQVCFKDSKHIYISFFIKDEAWNLSARQHSQFSPIQAHTGPMGWRYPYEMQQRKGQWFSIL